jgi:tripeptide aminopeptidase
MNWLEQTQNAWLPLRKTLTNARILNQALEIQQIPAPTFEEDVRARFIEKRFEQVGLQSITRDELHNVVGWLNPPDTNTKPILLVTAHLDTVFPADTDLKSWRENGRCYGAGLGDNSLGVAGLLILAESLQLAMRELNWKTDVSIGFVANSREEGLGNLDGIRTVIDSLSHERIGGVIVLEGMALGRIYHAGIAVRRLKISTQAEGGHSWLHFGQRNAIHDLMRLGADLSRIHTTHEPRTTYNIGMVEGGQSINSIPTHAHCLLDMRSTTSEGLAELESEVQGIIAAHRQQGADIAVEVIGDRPGGMISPQHFLIKMAQDTHKAIGVEGLLEQGSTDANYPFSRNIPAVVVGLTYGGNAHRLDEYIDIEPLGEGMWALLMLTVGVSERLAES